MQGPLAIGQLLHFYLTWLKGFHLEVRKGFKEAFKESSIWGKVYERWSAAIIIIYIHILIHTYTYLYLYIYEYFIIVLLSGESLRGVIDKH